MHPQTKYSYDNRDQPLDQLTEQAKANPPMRMHYYLRDSEEDTSMRILNAIEPSSIIPVHRHNMTSEDIIVLRGAVDVKSFDDKGNETKSIILKAKFNCIAVHISIGVFHKSVSLENESIIIEFQEYKIRQAQHRRIPINEYYRNIKITRWRN